MARIRKSVLSWAPSPSSTVVGYRLYWSRANKVDYNCRFVDLGNVTEVCLQDVMEYYPREAESFMLGITAVDEIGNESDMLKFPAPCQFKIPAAPTELLLEYLNEHITLEPRQESFQDLSGKAPKQYWSEHKVKFYDDVGYRQLTVE